MLPQDPVMLLSYLNTQLRDNYKSLDALADGLDISRDDLDVKRPGYGFPPERIDELVGKRIAKDIEEDMVLLEEYVE